MPSKLTQLELFGIPFTLGKLNDLIKKILYDCEKAADHHTQALMVVSMQDIVALRQQADVAAAFKNFDWFTPDGMPLVWLARLLGSATERLYGPDIFAATLAASAHKPIRHFFYGTDEKTLQQLMKKIQLQWPTLTIAGSIAPPFRVLTTAELKTLSQKINRAEPDIIWVGLGSTKQILFTSHIKALVKTHYIIPVGMAFDVMAGTKRQAPKLLQILGLEWLFRLMYEPERLWRRYFFALPMFAVWWWQELVRKLHAKFF